MRRRNRLLMTDSRSSDRSFVWGLFAALFAGEMGLGIYFAVFRDYVYYDAVSRVANAFYVLYSRDPHLGAVGFVWNPLPSLLELLPLLLWPVVPAVAAAGLAAVILTALFAAGTGAMLFRACRSWGSTRTVAAAFSLAFSLNPFVFIYGANGMSEAMFSFFIAAMVIPFTKWIRGDDSLYPIQIGFALALAFWVRYEAVALGAALAVCIAFIFFQRHAGTEAADSGRRLLEKKMANKLESTLIVALTPAFFSGMAWMTLNYFIMGDPLYFFRSGYSNMAFAGNLTDEFRALISSPAGVLTLVLRKSALFSVPMLAVFAIRFLTGRWKRWDSLALLALAASIPAMQFAMLLKGSSFGWLRFFVYPFVVTAAWMPYELSLIRAGRQARLLTAALCGSMLISGFVVLDMNNQPLSPDEYETFHISESGALKDMTIAKEVSAYTNRLIAGDESTLILTDSYSAYAVLLNSRYPRSWIITNDRDFDEALRDPFAFAVRYILVSRQEGSVLQVIHERYPGLFDHGEPWAELEKDFGGEWRLFRVTGATPDTAS